jgi:hypothetical protein
MNLSYLDCGQIFEVKLLIKQTFESNVFSGVKGVINNLAFDSLKT